MITERGIKYISNQIDKIDEIESLSFSGIELNKLSFQYFFNKLIPNNNIQILFLNSIIYIILNRYFSL